METAAVNAVETMHSLVWFRRIPLQPLTSSARSSRTIECFIHPTGFNQLPDFRHRPPPPSVHPPCDITHCACQPTANRRAGGGRRRWLGKCLSVFAGWRMVPAHNTHLDRRICMFAWRSVNVCDRCRLLCQG